jgi:hypothetical protein
MTTKTKTKVATVTNAQGVEFNVVVVPPGAAYGLEDRLTNDKGKPLVEFYDARYDFWEHGQFVSRYYAETLLPWSGTGLNLDGGVPAWTLEAAPMREAMAAVVAFLARGMAA